MSGCQGGAVKVLDAGREVKANKGEGRGASVGYGYRPEER